MTLRLYKRLLPIIMLAFIDSQTLPEYVHILCYKNRDIVIALCPGYY